MFVRTKTINGHDYFYLVKNIRDGHAVRQKVIKYLGAKYPSSETLSELINKYCSA
jgi:hypothetical protein